MKLLKDAGLKIIHRRFFTFLLVLMILFINGCKEKGCTDPNAINYNGLADEDDGSCIICKSTIDTLGTLSDDLVDNNFSSLHYNQAVATFTLIQLKNNFANTECGNNDCFFIVKIESHVPERMTFILNLQVSGNANISLEQNLIIQPNSISISEKIPSNSVSNPCGDISNATFFVSIFGVITYN